MLYDELTAPSEIERDEEIDEGELNQAIYLNNVEKIKSRA